MRIFFNLIIAILATASLGAAAQEPPGRAGRLAFAEGSVSVYMDPDIGWEPGYVNVPITSENSVWTDQDSRAELRVSGISLRLDETSQLDITELVDARLDATLARGAVNVRIRHFLNNDFIAINTPQARFILLAQGRYRIDSDPDRGDSRITVFEGRASMETRSGRVSVPRGQSMVVWGSERPEYALQASMTTEFDRWANARDSQWVETQSTRYVSTYMTGYEDLDSHGEWVQEPDYGPIWYPARVSAEWAPYRYGHWAWVRPWGWTWIDDQPWGYAPFHYGRWVNVHNRWAWYPGHRVERPLYAPALVAWVGGSNWSVGVRGSSAPVVGWYALTPFERYQPWYRANTAYVNNVNVNVYITNRDRAYRYADQQREFVRTHATVIQRDTFTSRRPVQQSLVQVTPEVMRQQPVVQQATAVLPSRNDFVRANQGRAINRQAAPVATGTQPTQRGEAATPAARPTPGANPLARGAIVGGTPSAPPVIAPPAEKPRFARTPTAPAPQAAAPSATPPPPAPVTRAQPPGQERSRFGPGAQPPAPGTPPSAKGQEALERRDTREAQQQQERAAREAQQQQQRAEQEKAAREAQQQQQRGQQEKAARDAQQQQQQQRAEQEKAAREAQQQQQRGQQEKAARDAQQQQQQQRAEQEKAAREAQQQQQRGQQEKAARDAQQQQQQQRAEQEKAAREAQQQQQRAQQEKAARDAQQQQQQQQQQQRAQQEKAARDAQQQQQRAEQEKAAREAQQQQQRAQQEKAAREAQQQQQQKAQPQPPLAQPQAQPQQPPPPPAQQKKPDKPDKSDKSDKGDDDDAKGKGKSR